MQADNAFGSDMSVVHEMLAGHNKINRTVTKLPNGIRTIARPSRKPPEGETGSTP